MREETLTSLRRCKESLNILNCYRIFEIQNIVRAILISNMQDSLDFFLSVLFTLSIKCLFRYSWKNLQIHMITEVVKLVLKVENIVRTP